MTRERQERGRGRERESHQSVIVSGRILYSVLFCGFDWEQRMIIMMMMMMKLS